MTADVYAAMTKDPCAGDAANAAISSRVQRDAREPADARGAAGSVDLAGGTGAIDGLHAIVDRQLAVYALHVRRDGMRRQAERHSGFGDGFTLRDELQDFGLPRSQVLNKLL